jgi:hypothetical protein
LDSTALRAQEGGLVRKKELRDGLVRKEEELCALRRSRRSFAVHTISEVQQSISDLDNGQVYLCLVYDRGWVIDRGSRKMTYFSLKLMK